MCSVLGVNNNGTAAIIMTGGFGNANWTSVEVEVLHSDGSPWCSLPDLPNGRDEHKQTGLEACGGDSSTVQTTCVRLGGGGDSWTPSHQLLQKRAHHSSWASPAGTLLMGGGYHDTGDTTELLDAATGDSAMHFPLKYGTR